MIKLKDLLTEAPVKKGQSEKLTNDRAGLREADPNNSGERCKKCSFFTEPNSCSIVQGPVGPDQVCDWIQSRGVRDVEQYQVSEEDWLAFGEGMIEKQPYCHIVRDVANTPEGPLVLIEDTAKPPHRFSLSKEFHTEHTNLEHHWTQDEVDSLVELGRRILASKGDE